LSFSRTQGKKPQDDDELGGLLLSFLTQDKNPYDDNEPFSLWLSSTIEKKKHKRAIERLVIIFCKYKTLGWLLLNAHTHIDRGVVLPSNSNAKASNSGL
jgi:hypothetical protein